MRPTRAGVGQKEHLGFRENVKNEALIKYRGWLETRSSLVGRGEG